MICFKCNETGIQNVANGNWFWYCQNCKEEIELQTVIHHPYAVVTLEKMHNWDIKTDTCLVCGLTGLMYAATNFSDCSVKNPPESIL